MSAQHAVAQSPTTLAEIRLVAEQVIDSDGDFSILASLEDGHHYMQWIEHDGAIYVELSDPTYNDQPPLDSAQLAAVATLGFEKRKINFGRDFAPDELDSDSLASFLLECFAEVFGITDPAMLELSVNR